MTKPKKSASTEVVIDDTNYRQFITNQIVDGEWKARGLIPRNYQSYPEGYYTGEAAFDMPLIPRSEWSALIQQMEETKSRLSDLRGDIPSRDQNGRGYCWIHSGCSALLLLRARDNQPYVDLSAYMGACIIKNYRDEGGWGAQGLDWIMEHGLPSSEFWPQKSVSRSNDTPAMRENAKRYRVSEGWMDLARPQYDRNLTFDQVMTCLLNRIPVIVDFNWWSHSVCACDPVETSPGKFGIRIWNSWGDGWSSRGMGVLSGSKAIPDGATAPRAATASS